MAVSGINIVELKQLINTNKRIAEALLGATKGVEIVTSIALELAAGTAEIGKVKISDGTDVLNVFGDGDSIDLEDGNEVVGDSKGVFVFAKDYNKKARFLEIVSNGGQNRLFVKNMELAELMNEMLNELKEIKLHLKSISGENFVEGDF